MRARPSPALLVYLLLSLVALAAQIPQNGHAGAGGIAVLQAREQNTDSPTTTDSTTAATDAATTAAATNNASSTSSTTAFTPTTTASLNQTSIAISGYTPQLLFQTLIPEDETSPVPPGVLPLKPKVTPGMGVAGISLIASGLALAFIGVRNLW